MCGDDHPVAWPLYNSKEPEQTKRDRYVHREPTDLWGGPGVEVGGRGQGESLGGELGVVVGVGSLKINSKSIQKIP